MINLRFPNITGKTEQEQLTQLRSYLHQLVQELNYELTQLEARIAEMKQDHAGR